MPEEPSSACLLEQIAAQQAHIATLDKRLRAAERAVSSAATPAAGVAAHRRADDTLVALEAAEHTLRRLTGQYAASATQPGDASTPRKPRAIRQAEQSALFDVG